MSCFRKRRLEVLKEIRAASKVPVIMLTAKGEEADRVVGLELGADDYLRNPSARELAGEDKSPCLEGWSRGMNAGGKVKAAR